MKTYIAAVSMIVMLLFYSTITTERVYVPEADIEYVIPFSYPNRIEMDSDQFFCLAQNVYFEARNQSLRGQAAVAMVVLNRVEDDFWPNDVCSVVKQGSYSSGKVELNQCQFSWYCDGLSDYPAERKTWYEIRNYVHEVYRAWNIGYDVTYGATNFHTTSILPYWGNDARMHYVVTIGDHKFYYWDRTKTVAFN